jgi:hypothetical protein
MNSEKIARLQDAVKRVQDELDACLADEFPKGARVAVFLRHGQQNPTWGEVFAIWNGNVQFKLENAKPRSSRPYRMVQPQQIVEVRGAA